MIAKLIETPLLANPGESLIVRTGCSLAKPSVFSRLPFFDDPRKNMWQFLILAAGNRIIEASVEVRAKIL